MAELATVARPYAKALYSLAVEHNKTGDWVTVLENLAKAVAVPKVAAAIDRPEQNAEAKAEVLLGLLPEGAFDERFKAFLSTLAENDRLNALPEIFTQFQALYLSASHIQKAVIYSAFPLTEAQFSQLVLDLQAKLGSKLDAKVEVDPELIGGVKVEVGDQVLDMSVQAELQKLYAAMTN
jgi:F-type H+-transporting ATPase subunit delta